MSGQHAYYASKTTWQKTAATFNVSTKEKNHFTISDSSPNQTRISAADRSITHHFFCFVCDAHVWDCDHLLEERLAAPQGQSAGRALGGSPLNIHALDF